MTSKDPAPILRDGNYAKVLRNMPLVDLFVVSPPYNIGSGGEKRYGDRKNGVYDAKSYGGITGYPDSMSEVEYQESQREFLRWCAAHLKRDGLIAYNHKIRFKDGVCIPPWEWFPKDALSLHGMTVWNRGSTHNHNQRHLYQHTELIFLLKRVDAGRVYVNSDYLHLSDLWSIPREYQKAKVHAAPFPVELPLRCIRLWCPPGGSVCDPYSGSGTTGVAAVMEGRRFYGAEMVKKYADHARARIRATIADRTQEKVA